VDNCSSVTYPSFLCMFYTGLLRFFAFLHAGCNACLCGSKHFIVCRPKTEFEFALLSISHGTEKPKQCGNHNKFHVNRRVFLLVGGCRPFVFLRLPIWQGPSMWRAALPRRITVFGAEAAVFACCSEVASPLSCWNVARH
jgi:hypothetical protein